MAKTRNKVTREQAAQETSAPGRSTDPSGQKVHLDTANLKSSYCNVCNATSTREEVVLNFGVNTNWDLGRPSLDVQLHHRIILSPFAAKRLQEMITKLMQEHEARYGELK